MRPHVNGYCAHENVLQTAHKKNPLRQQVAATGCNLTTYQAFHANNKWSPNHCYNGVRTLQHAKLPTTTTTPTTMHNYQMQQQQQQNVNQYQQHQQQQQQQQPQHPHAHLQRLNHFHNGYVAQPPLGGTVAIAAAAAASVAAETMSHNYAKLSAHAVNQQRINECAGIPLISNASTHLAPTHRQRLIRKSSQSPPHIMPHQQSPHNSQLMGLRTEAYASWNLPPTVRAHGSTYNNNNNHWQSLTTPFDNRFQTYVAAQQQQQQQQQQHNINVAKCSGKLEKSRLLRYQNSAPAVLSSIENTNNKPTTNTTATNEELKTTTTTTTTMNNSETKMMAETCLPRIIKPRKRRKKDRKPTANNNNNNNSNNNNNILISEQNMHNTTTTTIRAMKLNMIDCAAAAASAESVSGGASATLTKQYKSTENIFKQFSHNMAEKYANVNVNVNTNANANSLLPFYALGGEQLTNKSMATTTTNTFIPWNLNDENNLRSIWDYPLRRSFSDSSATNSNIKLCNNIWDAKSSASSSSNSSSSASSSSSSSSTYSLSSSTADSFFSADLYASQNLYPSRAEIVGVIGSNRHVNEQQNDINIDNVPRKALLSACLSDSNDSGYGDILTGINIANDLFNHTTTATTTKNNTTSVVNSYNLLTAGSVGSSASSSLLNAADEAANLLLLPATAETLLNESINEISRKLIETCGNEPMTDFLDGTTTTTTPTSTTNIIEMPHSACFSTCSEFSNDSGIETNNKLLNCNELIFNFDNLHMNDNNNNNNNNSCDMLLGTPSMSKLATTMENFLMHLNCNNNHLNDENNNEKEIENEKQQQHNQQFVKNCLNLVWPNGNEEVREPPITTMLNSMVELNTTAFSSH